MIEIVVDTKEFTRAMTELERNQLPFATSKAINGTLLAFQKAEQGELRDQFLLRRTRWVLQGVKINREDFARKDKLEGRVHLDRQRDFLEKFERGGIKRPRSGRSLAIPKEIRKNPRTIISAERRPKAFHFPLQPQRSGPLAQVFLLTREKRIIRRGKVVGLDPRAGAVQRLFMIRRHDGTGGIYERLGRGRGSRTKLLYLFTPRARIEPQLNWHFTAHKTVRAEWPRQFAAAFAHALRTAR